MKELKLKVMGIFSDITATNTVTGEVRKFPDFQNRILDIGLDRMAAGSYLDVCRVGSSNAPVLDSQTELQEHIATSTRIESSSFNCTTAEPFYGWIRNRYRFAVGTAAGTLAEIGVGWNTGAPRLLFSRALIKDQFGNPTTITIAPDEFLDVTYELRLYMDTETVVHENVQSEVVAGVPLLHTVTQKPALVGNQAWGSGLGSIVDQNSYGSFSSTAIYGGGAIGDFTQGWVGATEGRTYLPVTAINNYIAGSYYRDFNILVDLNDGNFAGGISGAAFFTNLGAAKIQFDPPLPKTASKRLNLRFRVSWGRYDPV